LNLEPREKTMGPKAPLSAAPRTVALSPVLRLVVSPILDPESPKVVSLDLRLHRSTGPIWCPTSAGLRLATHRIREVGQKLIAFADALGLP
jgi:hypothetical protein